MEWLVNNADEYQPPDGYLDWKIGLMSLIDPRFEEFLAPAAEGSRVNLFEIAWGGVGPTGYRTCSTPPWSRRRSRTIFSRGTGSSGSQSTESIEHIPTGS